MSGQRVKMNIEKKTLEAMVLIYCRKKHSSEQGICEDCRSLLEYATKRLDNCKFGNLKRTCRKCTIHCYKADMRSKIIEIMRFAGPRMIYTHPLLAFRHLINEI